VKSRQVSAERRDRDWLSMNDLLLKPLSGEKGTTVRVVWFGDVRTSVTTTVARARICVVLQAEGATSVEQRKDVLVPAGFFRFVRMGDVWREGRQVGSAPLVRETFRELVIDDTTTTVSPAGAPTSLPDGTQRFDLRFEAFDGHRAHTASWVAKVELDSRSSLVVPCMELARFYFSESGSLAAQLFSGARAAGGLYVDWYLSAATGVANLTLGVDLNGAAASTVARIASDKAARRAFWDVVKSGVADHANRKPWYPRMRFPLIGRTDLTCEGEPRWPPKFPRLWPPQTPPPELIGDRG